MRVSLMIEGQEGVTWPQWVALARACEDGGLEGLFRSDHYTGFLGGRGGSLDAWATIAALSAVTERIQLGTLVSPATFRHPSVLARMAVTANHVSDGRVELGLGAGWNEAEHLEHGFPFMTARERVALFAEQLEIIHRSWGEEPFEFVGRFYELLGADPLPKPIGRLNLIVGGSARPGTVEPAVRFADEYNTGFVTPQEAHARRLAVEHACARAARPPLTFSLMARCTVGEDRAAVTHRLERIASRTGPEPAEYPQVTISGTVAEVAERLHEYREAGVERFMLQHLLHDDLEMVDLLAREVVPLLG